MESWTLIHFIQESDPMLDPMLFFTIFFVALFPERS